MSIEENHGFSLKRTNREEIEEVPYGMYVWVSWDGDEVFCDDDDNVMNVFCMKGDHRAQEAVEKAAKFYGAPAGRVMWWGGKRQITDEELQEQMTRERLGLEPDPLNPAALRDEARARHFHG